jgi:hypothetical protein
VISDAKVMPNMLYIGQQAIVNITLSAVYDATINSSIFKPSALYESNISDRTGPFFGQILYNYTNLDEIGNHTLVVFVNDSYANTASATYSFIVYNATNQTINLN